ncbi:2,3-bisphosphoglycerate-independent phosphoglycerate mutase [uncultured Tyzzerella sp.]|uniref:2,3-bisphosphoglycerate-independent phosphoglycerate mutase n=1 Tax=uncultured Tyzzerella sp. TaxID=2321398 RepID=UPI00294248E0|nr:2,3-bisphosphoglycerate-independent phosphoglycerate mutase [uncultured Tyzzerella sp.]
MGKKTTVLMILDGFGINEKTEGNAIKLANTPNIDKITKGYPCVNGNASGLFVGLPDGQMGNSEVGHLNMGAGRIVYQELTRITKSIQDGDFFENSVLKGAMENCKERNTALHLMGLLSSGGVHSHNEHLYGLLKMAKMNGIEKVYIHAFLDGRDTPPTSGKGFLQELQSKINEIGVGKIATISGRYYAMDRDNRWERVEHAYNAMVMGKGDSTDNVITYIESSYSKDVNDEFVVPTVVTENDMPVATINENDSVIFFNYRPDRAREMTRAFCDEDFTGFDRDKGYFNTKFVTFTDYDSSIKNKEVVFLKESLSNTFGEYISNLGLTQLRLAETEKYAHVTFFFNGGVEEPYKNEDRILIPSPQVATYDLQPEMSAKEVTEKLTENIANGKYDLIIVNYANPDMVGHTGVLDAAVKAIEYVDECIGKVVDTVLENNAQMFICADHGNSDQLIDYTTKEPFTAHTTNPVPFILVNCDKAKGLKEGGKLADIAPTLLDMMNLEQPKEMTGESLLVK